MSYNELQQTLFTAFDAILTSRQGNLTEHHTNHKSQIGHALHSTFVDFVALGDLT